MTSTRPYRAIVATCCMLMAIPSALAEAEAEKFELKFEAGKTLKYEMVLKLSMAMTVQVEDFVQSSNMTMTMNYDVAITPTGHVEDDITRVNYQPSNISAKWDIDSNDSKILMSLKGEHLVATADGQQFIDTENGIGVEEGEDIKKEMAALYLDGKMDFDPLGNLKHMHGDDAFVEFWTETLAHQVGFFGIVFPKKPVAEGDKWKEFLTIKELDKVTLDGDGLRCDMEFTRLPDLEIDGIKQAQFELSAPFNHRDVKATMEGMGGETDLNIDKFDRTASGKMRFDPARGVFTHGMVEVDAGAIMKTVGEGPDMNMDMKIGMVMELQLVE